jgi:hypothetical protein
MKPKLLSFEKKPIELFKSMEEGESVKRLMPENRADGPEFDEESIRDSKLCEKEPMTASRIMAEIMKRALDQIKAEKPVLSKSLFYPVVGEEEGGVEKSS